MKTHSTKMISRIIAALAVSINVFATATIASAEDITGYLTDEKTGWKRLDEDKKLYFHLGTKTTTYKFENAAIRQKYEKDLQNGIKLWGTQISCSYSSKSETGLITQVIGNSEYTAATGALRSRPSWVTGRLSLRTLSAFLTTILT